MRKLLLLPVLSAFLSLSVWAEAEAITIASFNIQIFGVSKMSKPAVVSILTDIVSRYDLAAVQEVRSVSEEPVLSFMALLPPRYSYVLGPREGRSSSKEQFWIIYDTEKLTLLDSVTWPDPDDIYERNPLGVYFKTAGDFDFILIDNHVKPSDTVPEISALPDVAAYFQTLWHDDDVLIVGDLNADGSYYDERLLIEVFPETGYTIIITNEYDTTTAASSNTYDRIIITKSAEDYYTGNFGVLRYDELFDFEALGLEPKNVSDHFPVWAEFSVDRAGPTPWSAPDPDTSR
ncbi:deoxyribonuclease [Spirochaetia bacterium]|nr:deoxyribonuclease [Spirochaetia bacterium]